jgi:hypothetical protein
MAGKQGAHVAPTPTPEDANGTVATQSPPPLNDTPSAATPSAVPADPGAMMMTMMQQFMDMMSRQQEQQMRIMEERFARLEQNVAPQRTAIEDRPAVSVIEEAEMAPQYNAQGGLIPPPQGRHHGMPHISKMVAFIPREDPLNRRQTMFQAWLNGREIRARRGQVVMVSRGFGVDLARNRQGHVVDIAAMQGGMGSGEIPVQQTRDFSMPANWDGRPLTDRSSFVPPPLY